MCTRLLPFTRWIITSTRYGSALHRSRGDDLRRRPKAAIHGRRRPKAAIGQRPRRDRRRPKAGVGACRASRARTLAEAPIQVRKGPFDPPLCVSSLVCPSDTMLLPSSAIRHAMALCDLLKYPAALSTKPKPMPFNFCGPLSGWLRFSKYEQQQS